MRETVGDFLVKRLSERGRRLASATRGTASPASWAPSTGPGTTPSSSRCASHEEMASLLAWAHIKFTVKVGVCLATSRPGRYTC